MDTAPVSDPQRQQLKDNLLRVRQRLHDAAERAGHDPRHIVLVAVTKLAELPTIQALLELGQQDFGENRVQQLTERATALVPPDPDQPPRWHMIGHLQRNKVKQVVPLVRLVHSVDTMRLAEEIHKLAVKQERDVEILLQVNIAQEESKFGLPPGAVRHVADQVRTMLHVRLRGLMTIAPYSENPEDARPVFARCRELFEEIRDARGPQSGFDILSMGMSGDYPVAIEEGANVVRVGSALFEGVYETP